VPDTQSDTDRRTIIIGRSLYYLTTPFPLKKCIAPKETLSYHEQWVPDFVKEVLSASLEDTTRMYPKLTGLAAWNENCKWYRFLPLDVVLSLFCEPGCFSTSVFVVVVDFVRPSPGTFGYILV